MLQFDSGGDGHAAQYLDPLADGQPVQHKEPGQLIYLQDTRAECFYYIVSGTVKCYISSPEGEERILTLPHAGELIGEAAFFDRQPRVSSAVAVTPASWWRWTGSG